jgi:aerobic carbon-monoxide dehydrogenase medium subunit
MFPAAFDYYSPTSVPEAVKLLGNGNKILAGGHSLLPLMKLRLAEPPALVDIGRIAGLDEIGEDGGTVVIGARATHSMLEHSPLIARAVPLLAQTAAWIGDIQVRGRGTIGGSLAHADPGGDLPAAILALDALLTAVGPSGSRTIAAADFFRGMLSTALADDEILTEVRVAALPPRTGTAYQKFPNPASRYAIVGVAAVVTLGSDGAIARAAIGVTGFGEQAFRASAVESALAGKRPTEAEVTAAAEQADQGRTPLGDIHASDRYRRHLSHVLAKRAVLEAASRAA